MAISSVIAIAGIALAAFIWLRRRDLAAAIAARFRGLYRLLLNKSYVDEVYDAAVVKPIRTGSENVLWQGLDVRSDRRCGQWNSAGRCDRFRRAAPPADRLGARVCRFDVHRRHRDSWLLPMEMNQMGFGSWELKCS